MLLDLLNIFPIALILGILLFMTGLFPVPVGYDRGKIKFIIWCGTGMHAHIVYWHGGGSGFQSIHPDDIS